MKNRAEISGIASKYGLGDGDWFSRLRGMYAALGVRMGEAILANNPKACFTVEQVETTHNPIRVVSQARLDLSGSVSLGALKPLDWSSPTFTWVRDDDANGGIGEDYREWDYTHFNGVIFEVTHGAVVYRRDRDGIAYKQVSSGCQWCGNTTCGMFTGSTICEPDLYSIKGPMTPEFEDLILKEWGEETLRSARRFAAS